MLKRSRQLRFSEKRTQLFGAEFVSTANMILRAALGPRLRQSNCGRLANSICFNLKFRVDRLAHRTHCGAPKAKVTRPI